MIMKTLSIFGRIATRKKRHSPGSACARRRKTTPCCIDDAAVGSNMLGGAGTTGRKPGQPQQAALRL
jgi:hypothetical protein